MNAQRTRELAGRYWESLNRRDWVALREILSKDVIYEVSQDPRAGARA